MTMQETSFMDLRLRLAIRKALLSMGDHRGLRTAVRNRFSWASKKTIDTVIDEYVREGMITVEKGVSGGEYLQWHEENLR